MDLVPTKQPLLSAPVFQDGFVLGQMREGEVTAANNVL
jgi:hypothetical protein